MKTTSIKAFLILFGLMLICIRINAQVGEKIKSFVGSEYSQFHIQGLYVIAGIIAVSVIINLLVMYFTREDEKTRPNTNVPHHRRHHHHHRIVKKSI